MMKPFKRIILHIGGEKTGSTRLQHALHEQRDVLLKHGIYTPLTANLRGNCWGFAALAQHEPKNSFYTQMRRNSQSESNGHFELTEAFQKEFDHAPDSVDTLLISSEHLQTEVNVRGLRRLFDWMETLASEVHVVYVVRRQDEILKSLLTTIIRGNAQLHALLNESIEGRLESPRLNHWLTISRYLCIPTQCKVTPHIITYGSGSLLPQMDEALRESLGLPDEFKLPAQRSNPGLPDNTIRFMSTLLHPVFGSYCALKQPQRRELTDILTAKDTSPPFAPPRSWAKRVVDPFRASNQRTRETFLPNAESLFTDSSFHDYPDINDYSLAMNRAEFTAVLEQLPELVRYLPGLENIPDTSIFDLIMQRTKLA